MTCETENAFCSVYEKDGEYLAVVSLFDEQVREVILRCGSDVQVLGNVPGHAAVRAEGNLLTLCMDAFRPALIRFTMK